MPSQRRSTKARNQSWTDEIIGRFREATSVQLISPVSLSLIAILPLAVSVLLPPFLYETVVQESDLMFMNTQLIAFYGGCIALYIAGCLCVPYKPQQIRISGSRPLGAESPKWLMIAIPLALSILINLVSMIVLIKANPDLLSALFSGRGNDLKSELETSGAMVGAQPLALAALWWGMMRYLVHRRSFSPETRIFCLGLLIAAGFVAVAAGLIKLARYEIIPLILGCAFIWIRIQGAGRSAWYYLRIGFFVAAAVLAIFCGAAFLRGAYAFKSLMGYGPASFNHLAATLSGMLAYNAHGEYTTYWFRSAPVLGNLLGTANAAFENHIIAFKHQFSLTSAAGLNGGFIWITSWGYIYSDIGYWVLLVAFSVGIFTGCAWRAFNKVQAWGVVFYAKLATTILLWSTSSLITGRDLVPLAVTALLLWAWESLPVWKTRTGLARSTKSREA